MRTYLVKNREATLYACGMTFGLLLLTTTPVLAQAADQLGMSTINTYYLAIAKVVAAMAATTVALLCMKGGHPLAAVVPVIGGALAIGKMSTILGWMGLT